MFFRQAEGHPRGPGRFEVREEGLHPLVSTFYAKAVPVPEESAGGVGNFQVVGAARSKEPHSDGASGLECVFKLHKLPASAEILPTQ